MNNNTTPAGNTTFSIGTTTITPTGCQVVDSQQNISSVLCNFSIPSYSCSLTAVLSSDDVVTLLTCKLPVNYTKDVWKVFFQRFAAPLDEALDMFSNRNGFAPIDSRVLDALVEVKINNFTAAQLINAAFITQWFQTRLRPFLLSVSPEVLSILGSKNFSCDTFQIVLKGLDVVRSNLSTTQLSAIVSYIKDFIKDKGLTTSCYREGSLYVFLKQFFLSFGFPDLSNFLAMIPSERQSELLSSISTGELRQILNETNTVSNASDLCTLLNNYNKTIQYLEMEPVPSTDLARQTLGCVWPHALGASSQAEFNQWFDVRLARYLPFLTSQMLSSSQLTFASCLSYRKILSFLKSNFTFTASLTRADVYSGIKGYLKSTSGTPRCYNATDPILNSTSWFADNIGEFINFITISDLQSFGTSNINLFLENPTNLQLFNNPNIPDPVLEYYTTQLLINNPSFSPISLPFALLCRAPVSMFESLGVNESKIILQTVKNCTGIDPVVSAVLVKKFPTVTADTIATLGSQSVGLSVGQINSVTPEEIKTALSTLSTVSGWDKGQANALVQSIVSSGVSISSGNTLASLGTLITGVPAQTMTTIPSNDLLNLTSNPTFISNIQSAPEILQQTFVQKIVSADTSKVITNVPDALVSFIPPVLLTTTETVNVSVINKKSWNPDQARLLFGSVASADTDAEDLSESVLQGFTCSSVQTLSQAKVKNLVRACRPRDGRKKVVLKESQLTCMYNYVKDDTLSFSDVPSDMLLYFSYDKVPKESCRSYFTAMGVADFSVLSSVLNTKTILFSNAQSCLGISSFNLTKDHVDVLGNMTCTLDAFYIQNSDPSMVDKMLNCPDLSDTQSVAVQSLLSSGKTSFGDPSTWNQQTLLTMGNLPLYFKRDIWGKITTSIKKTFLKYFLPVQRSQKTSVQKLKAFFTECNAKFRSRRSTGCTTENITASTIADESFPIGYDAAQFDACLDNTVLKDNLASITTKVVDSNLQAIILSKLNEIYPSGLSDSVVQLLGSTSREASTDDIKKWNITTIDTLSILMDSKYGVWAANKSKAVITRYLSVVGNMLGTAELNAIASNLCSLDASILSNITSDSLKNANTLDLTSCTFEQKAALYPIAKLAFSSQATKASTYFTLISPFLGGAPLVDIQALSTQNISIDMTTFLTLNPDVVTALNVSTVKGLLGVNLPDLKLYENTTLVQSWVVLQFQSDLNTLNINLVGGKAAVTTTAPPTTTSTVPPITTATPTTSTINTTTGSSTTGNTTTTGGSTTGNTTTTGGSTTGNTNTTGGSTTGNTTTTGGSITGNTTTTGGSTTGNTTTTGGSTTGNTTTTGGSTTGNTTTTGGSTTGNTTTTGGSTTGNTTTTGGSTTGNTTTTGGSTTGNTNTTGGPTTGNTTTTGGSTTGNTNTTGGSTTDNFTTTTAGSIITPPINTTECKVVDSQKNISPVLCNFSIPGYACSMTAVLSSDDLVTLLTCKLPVNYTKDVWKLFFQRFAAPLDEALDKFSNRTVFAPIDPRVLDALVEVKINNFTAVQLIDTAFITQWFRTRLRPFLSSVSSDALFIFASKNFSCETYRIVVEALRQPQGPISEKQKQTIFTSFILPFLLRRDQPDPGCIFNTTSSRNWLEKNFGNFSVFATLEQLQRIKADFSSLAILDLLSSQQKVQLILKNESGVLGNITLLREVLGSVIVPADLNQTESFFFAFKQSADQMNLTSLPPAASDTILSMVLTTLAPHLQTFNPQEVARWVQTNLRLFLPGFSPTTLSIIPLNLSCDLYREIMKGFNSVSSTLSTMQSNAIFIYTQDYFKNKGSNATRCYGGGSFFVFLKQFFLSFQFPDLNNFLAMIPADRQPELLSSISTGELREILNGTNTVSNTSDLCTLLNNYNKIIQYLGTEPVPHPELARQTLECVWPLALGASSPAEVNQWFDASLVSYLPFFNPQMLSSSQLSIASCLSYRKIVSFLGSTFTFTDNFTQADVYSRIKGYLKSTGGTPRCYNPTDPNLNSTSWFADNIGVFINFITISDLQSFGTSNISLFLENPTNLQLFNNPNIPDPVLQYYTTQLQTYSPRFSPLSLPKALLCRAPSTMFESLGVNESKIILQTIKNCTGIDPAVSAVLVKKFPTVTADTIAILGSQSVGLTVSQISSASADVIKNALPTLSTVSGWDRGQANALVQSIISSGVSISSADTLASLGTLIVGVPVQTISAIPMVELIFVSRNPTFITNIQSAPVVLQQAFVQKIASIDTASVMSNVPDTLAMFIPPFLLTTAKTDVTAINKKSWSNDQARLLFGSVASADTNIEDLSESILQGFTCSSVQTLTQVRIRDLVKACRPRTGRKKVVLKETQLTCMYNYIKQDTTLTFSDMPSDMLLYYSYDKVQKAACRSYFTALGKADFSVMSGVLNKKTILFNNARDCLGISGFSLTKDHVDVLGNMVCTLNSTYIQNSDPYIVEKMLNCSDLSDDQIVAVQSLLSGGKTSFGVPSTWNQQTLLAMGNLPLYFKRDTWGKITTGFKTSFLKYFLPVQRSQKTSKQKLRAFFTECNSNFRSRRTTGCTTGNITSATIADESFPLGYDAAQFEACLDNTVLKDNLASVTTKVVDSNLQAVILIKLNQIYPSGLSDSVVQLLGSTSHEGSIEDINKWNITMIDTLASLMDSTNGDWETDKSKAVITRYLSVAGNSLGTAELNAIGSNLCSLDVSVLKNITSDNLRNANALNVTSCSTEQKSALYTIANASFSSQRSNAVTFYTLISSYLGGAPLADIQTLSTQNVSMDMNTFLTLDPNVVTLLNLSTVKGLLGVNLPDLKLFENTTLVQSWVKLQLQSELDTLNIGLVGGRETTATTITTATTTKPTGNHAPTLPAGGKWFLSLCVGLLSVTLYTL